MDGKRFLNSVKFTNLLSFGPEGMELELQPLNVLIGANGCGKSNFIEGIRLGCNSINGINKYSIGKGMPSDWYFKGGNSKDLSSIGFHIDYTVSGDVPQYFGKSYLEYYIGINFHEVNISLYDEFLNLYFKDSHNRFYLYHNDALEKRISRDIKDDMNTNDANNMEIIDFKGVGSILEYSKNRKDMGAISFLSDGYSKIRIYNRLGFGPDAEFRKPQDTAIDSDYLFEDGSNLALVVNNLQNRPHIIKKIVDKLKIFYESVENIITIINGGRVQIFFQEENLSQTIPASRLSDGTMRYLCLLVALLHPEPPPLICIEEPELGMHPDIIPIIADLLIETSQRTQLIITTHSDILVSAIGRSYPEAIVVCDKDKNSTRMKRLDPEKMSVWLEKYSMGELWTSGEIGGTRW